MYYSGIGSRKAPDDILALMELCAMTLEAKGYKLRSGGAGGSDKAFERGVWNSSNKEIFRPEHATSEAIKLASTVHPAWHNCNDYTRKLHGRNSQIILGKDLDTPVEFVVCWTPGGKVAGGTGLGIRLAQSKNIPVYNIYHKAELQKLISYLGGTL